MLEIQSRRVSPCCHLPTVGRIFCAHHIAVDSSLHLHVHQKFFHAHVRCEFESISISTRPTMLHDSPNAIYMTNVSIPHPHSPNITKDPGVGNQEYTVISPDDTNGLCTSWSFATLNESRSTDVPLLTQQDVTGAPVSTSFPTLLPRTGDHPVGKQLQSRSSSLHSPAAVILGDDNAIVGPPTTTTNPSSIPQATSSFEPRTHQESTIISGSARSVSSISHASSRGTQSKRQRKSESKARLKARRSKKSDSKHTIRSKKLKASSADNRWSKRFHWPDEVSKLSFVLLIDFQLWSRCSNPC